MRGTKEFRALYPICLTDKHFADRDRKIPGYIDAIYLLDWTAIGCYKKVSIEETTLPEKAAKRKPTAEELAEVRGPRITRKRSRDKVAIALKYCSYQIDTTKKSFKDALRKGEHRASECWINTIYDNFQDKLL